MTGVAPLSASTGKPLLPAGLVLAIWPVVIVHLCFVLSVQEGFVPLCNPYWDGCTSISRSGRHGWAFFLFKAGMLPYATGLAIFWWLCDEWLRCLDGHGAVVMRWAGWVGAVFLVLYATFLGSDGALYQWLRRSGIHVYFAMTFLAQALLIVRLSQVAGGIRRAGGQAPWPTWLLPTMAMLATLVVVSGLAFAIVGRMMAIERDRLENAIEWAAALMMQTLMLLAVLGWGYSQLRLGLGGRAIPEPARADRSGQRGGSGMKDGSAGGTGVSIGAARGGSRP